VVDDTVDTRELYALYFRSLGFTVLTAHDGITGVAMARDKRPDIIVMDLSMPGLDGIAATRQLKADPRTHRTPVIILTGYPMRAIQDGALDAGADAFLTKPCLPEELDQHVQRLLARAAGAASPAAPPQRRDSAAVAALLRRLPGLCAGCIATKLGFSAERVIDAVSDLAATAALDQHVGGCAVCGRSRWVIALPR
jgi:two-component system, cell cycle response regulator DivK